ncbi:FAD-dependent oxidoreductase [Planotetraspora kaengkrachanensis]|uniref:NADH dehydrogenase n=1 Tax=Planotetraspora kaengkrachanensis TaxID=575193 RepID=A0A8J3LVU2_9ACTN|nr:NADH dehydrogenase [Planotetraspora kaengkrachanensis]
MAVLGAGYGGLRAAFGLARDVRVTLIDPADSFTERVRLHERAAGRQDVRHTLRPLLRASGVTHLAERVSRIDTAASEVHTDDGRVVGYDRLVYALGSRTGDPGPARPGRVFTAETAAELHRRLHGEFGRLTVVGGGPTGVETAAELAESHPEWDIRLVTAGQVAPGVSRRGRAHIRSVLTGLGVAIEEDHQVPDADDLDSDVVVWSASMVPNTEIAKAAGLTLDEHDRITVDPALRSTSHPEVYVAGDAAAAYTPVSGPLRMACATALPVGLHAARSVVRDLGGLEPRPLKFSYYAQCISLGRHDGLLQFVGRDDSPRDRILTGRAAALVKEQIVRTTVRTIVMTARSPRAARLIPGVN